MVSLSPLVQLIHHRNNSPYSLFSFAKLLAHDAASKPLQDLSFFNWIHDSQFNNLRSSNCLEGIQPSKTKVRKLIRDRIRTFRLKSH